MAYIANATVGMYSGSGVSRQRCIAITPKQVWVSDPALPIATASVAGVVKQGSGPVAIAADGTLSVDALSVGDATTAIAGAAAVGTAAGAAAASALSAAQAAQSAADAKIATSTKGAANGVASLGADGKLDPAQIPSITTNDTHVVANEMAMLALNVDAGDVAVRTDLSKSFILRVSPANVLGNWQELLSPASPVQSIAGRTGAVTLSAGDIAGLNTVATSGSYTDLANKPRLPKIFTDASPPDGTEIVGDQFHTVVAGVAYVTFATMSNGNLVFEG